MPANGSSEFRTPPHTGAAFEPTHWTVVLSAGGPTSPDSRRALEQLCQSYWPPIYAFLRRRGHPVHDAEDLTQGLFAEILQNESIANVGPAKGKFRSFLLGALQHFLANERDKAQTLKRGGQFEFISWDQVAAENFSNRDPTDCDNPEKSFERCWATALVEQGINKLKQEHLDAGKGPLFAALQQYLTGETGPGSYAEAASKLNLSEGAVKVALHRLRRRFGELLRSEIAQTVTSPDEIDEEIRHLFGVLGS